MDEVSGHRSRGEQQCREHRRWQQRLLLTARAPVLDRAPQPRILIMRPTNSKPGRHTHMPRMHRYLAGVMVSALVAACSADKLTEVETPDQITPEQANSAPGAAALRTAALGNFANFFAG